METKYVCRGLISLYVNFHNNRTMWSTKLHEKICRCGGGKEKEPSRHSISRNQSSRKKKNPKKMLS